MTAHANGTRQGGQPVTLTPLRGPVSGWPQDDPGQSGTTVSEPERRHHPDGDAVIRVLAAIVVLAVAAFAAIVSYSHIFELGFHHGQDGAAARLLPLSVDGLIASASLVMLHAARRNLDVPWLARAMLTLGVGATVAANVGYGLPFGWLSAVVSAWPAVAFVGSVEMAVRFVRDARHDGGGLVQSAVSSHEDDPEGKRTGSPQDKGVDKRVDKPEPRKTAPARTAMDKAAAAIARHSDWTDAALAKSAGVSTKTIQRARNAGSRT